MFIYIQEVERALRQNFETLRKLTHTHTTSEVSNININMNSNSNSNTNRTSVAGLGLSRSPPNALEALFKRHGRQLKSLDSLLKDKALNLLEKRVIGALIVRDKTQTLIAFITIITVVTLVSPIDVYVCMYVCMSVICDM